MGLVPRLDQFFNPLERSVNYSNPRLQGLIKEFKHIGKANAQGRINSQTALTHLKQVCQKYGVNPNLIDVSHHEAKTIKMMHPSNNHKQVPFNAPAIKMPKLDFLGPRKHGPRQKLDLFPKGNMFMIKPVSENKSKQPKIRMPKIGLPNLKGGWGNAFRTRKN